MEKAKAAVSSIIGRTGHHDTTVDESVAPGVTKEEIKPTRHENVQEAVDREVHQDHYHTTVQPVQHQEVLPEQHSHQMAPVQNREFEHDDASQTRRKLESEAGRFKDTSTTHETQHTTGVAPVAEGEHVHHHVHENVQPVVHKETIQPEVVHTTVPIHEVHRADAEHHGTSVLPMKNMEDFTAGGGILTGGGQKAHETYEGDPKPYNTAMQMDRTDADVNFKAHDGLHDHQRAMGSGGGGNTTAGPHSSNLENKMDPRVDSDRGLGTTGAGAGTGAGTGMESNTTGAGMGSNTTGTGIDSQSRVDPRVDASGSSLPSTHQEQGAAAGVGAAGVAAGGYEAERHHDTNTSGRGVGDTAQTTSGPHGSNLENKLDPRVDSDRDRQSGLGSNTQGGTSANDPVSAPGTSTTGDNASGATGVGSRTGGALDQDPTNVSTTGSSQPRGNYDATSTDAPTSNSNQDPASTRSGLVGSSSSNKNNNDTRPDPQAENSTTDRSTKMSDENPDTTASTDNTAGEGEGGNASGNVKGQDPSVVDDKSRKLTGTGVPGSHSALFGLTPDGHKESEVDYSGTKPGGGDDAAGEGGASGDTGSRAPEGSGVKEQLDDPKVSEKGHGGDSTTTDESSGKPGGGSSVATPSQGSGTVGEDA